MQPANLEMWNDLCKSVDLRRIGSTELELVEEFNEMISYNVGLGDIINHFTWLANDNTYDDLDSYSDDELDGSYHTMVDFDRDDY